MSEPHTGSARRSLYYHRICFRERRGGHGLQSAKGAAWVVERRLLSAQGRNRPTTTIAKFRCAWQRPMVSSGPLSPPEAQSKVVCKKTLRRLSSEQCVLKCAKSVIGLLRRNRGSWRAQRAKSTHWAETGFIRLPKSNYSALRSAKAVEKPLQCNCSKNLPVADCWHFLHSQGRVRPKRDELAFFIPAGGRGARGKKPRLVFGSDV
jgi:hypothetical protein